MVNTTRTDQIVAEVRSRTHIWDAFDQGRWAHSIGEPISANPHGPYYPGYFHVNMTDWTRGWNVEAEQAA